mgnify:CR=1 FL=1|nr:MAG TPA: hypothetical protein [Bacteriophage sp.]
MNKFNFILIIIIMLLASGFGVTLSSSLQFRQRLKESIKPIDVYRGKTELQIKCVIINNDTVSCDSTVVWKHLN